MLFRQIIGEGKTAEEALLWARLNQIGYDKGIKDKTISKKTKIIEFPVHLFTINCDKIITAIHIAHFYYIYNKHHADNCKEPIRRFTETEYNNYSLLIKRLGKDLFNKIMIIYSKKDTEECIGLKYRANVFKIMY